MENGDGMATAELENSRRHAGTWRNRRPYIKDGDFSKGRGSGMAIAVLE